MGITIFRRGLTFNQKSFREAGCHVMPIKLRLQEIRKGEIHFYLLRIVEKNIIEEVFFSIRNIGEREGGHRERVGCH